MCETPGVTHTLDSLAPAESWGSYKAPPSHNKLPCCLGHTAGRRALISHFYGKFSIPPHLVLFPWKRNRQRHPSSLVWDTYHILLAMKHVQLERDFWKKLVNFWPLDGSTRWVFAHCTSRTKMRKQGKLNHIFLPLERNIRIPFVRGLWTALIISSKRVDRQIWFLFYDVVFQSSMTIQVKTNVA